MTDRMSEEKKNQREKKPIINSIVFPDGVVSKEEYIKYIELTTDPLINEDRYYEASDGQIVDLLTSMYVIRKRTIGLPDTEKKFLEEEATKRRRIIGQIGAQKRKAWGQKSPRFGKSNTVLDKTLEEKKTELIELFGRFYSVTEIHKIVTTEYGLDISLFAVRKFREENDQIIREKQELFKKDYSDLRLGYKRSRLDELHYLYNDRKQTYQGSKGKEDYKLLLATIEQIRKEVEGERLTVDANIELTIEQTLHMHVQKELMSELSITNLIVSNLCGKLGLDPLSFMTRLTHSYYAKFNNLIGNPQYEDEIIYPSEVPYDFDKIKKQKELEALNKENKLKILPLTISESQEIKDNKAKGKSLKDLIIQQVMEKKRTIQKLEDRMKGMEGGEEEFTNITYEDVRGEDQIGKGGRPTGSKDKTKRK